MESFDSKNQPFYNIGVVTRATGIPIATLHAWERRYGFPHSSRTSGGHRLYTERDISLLRWVKAQVDAGLATRQAILAAERLNQVPSPEPAAPLRAATQATPLPALRESLLKTLLENDLAGADRLLGEMLAFYTPEELTLNVIGPCLQDIGEDWEMGDISVAEEHLASNYLRQRLLMWMVGAPRPRPGKPVILACAPGEWHDGSLLMLGVLLSRQGVPVAYLGQNVPFADLADFAAQVRPAAVVLVAMREETAAALQELPQWLMEGKNAYRICFGGRAFVLKPELKKGVAGIYLGDSIQEGMDRLVNEILKRT